MLISLCYSPTLQRLSVGVLRVRGLPPPTDTGRRTPPPHKASEHLTVTSVSVWGGAGVCVQVSLQIHTQVVKVKRSGVLRGESDPACAHRTTFKLRPPQLDEACLRFELRRPSVRSGGTPDSSRLFTYTTSASTSRLTLLHQIV